MNKYLDIIPTPKHCEYKVGSALNIQSMRMIGERTEIINSALLMLEKQSVLQKGVELMVCNGEAHIDKTLFSDAELEIFKQKYGLEQGYILKITNGKAIIAAKGELGCAYGIMTFLQLIGKSIGEAVICDCPDFRFRGIKWTIWAETGIWSYDFGDGAEAIKKRVIRKLDTLMKYKINYVHADGFGFDADRFPEYSDIMKTVNDEARKRGIHLISGGYSMSYGMVGYKGTYQGKDFYNRKSYPNGETYDCIGTYDPYTFIDDKTVDRSVRLSEVRGRDRGTCLSNSALLDEKMNEITDYLKKTHAGGISLHNMDAHEIHPELWKARCACCRQKWPNDDLFAPDGAAGAFAYYIDSVLERIRKVKDGDYDASKHTVVRMASPGYLYAEATSDEDFDTGIKFWSKVTEYMKDTRNFAVGFREQFFYHEKDLSRAEFAENQITSAMSFVHNFCGADGFYDDKLFTPTASLNYIMKGYDGIICANGNAFQEPLQLFNAQYLWNSMSDVFYSVNPKPENQNEFLRLFYDMINSRVRPPEIYDENGFIDIICQKLYGEKHGKKIACIYKLSGKNGEQPIPCASNVDIYTGFAKIVFPMRWDNTDITSCEIALKYERFSECARVTCKAHKILAEVLEVYDGGNDVKADLKWLCECFDMGARLCLLFEEYMKIYQELDNKFKSNSSDFAYEKETLKSLKSHIADYLAFVDTISGNPVDKFGGAEVRRREMGEHLDYWVDIMLLSIETNNRIPDNIKPLATKEWW